MSKQKSIKKNYILNLIYQITLIIVPLIVTPYSSRALLPEGTGQYSFCYSIITYFTLFATFGFDIYGQREIAKYQNDKEKQAKAFWEITICKLITTSISLLVLGLLISLNIFGSENTTIMFILSINIIATGLDIAFYFQGNEDFGKPILINIIIKILGASAIFIFVNNPEDVWIYTLIHSSMILISTISLWIIVLSKIEKTNIKNLNPFQHLRKALSLFIPAIATTIYCILDKTLIGVITNSNAQNGYYEQAEKIVKLAMTLITCLGAVMIPRNTNEISQGNHEKVKANIYSACNFVFLLGIPLTLGIILVADNLIPWFLGDGYEDAILLLKVFAPLILFIGFSNIFGQQYLVPYQKDKLYTMSLICGAIINLVLNIIFIHLWGALGATISTIIAELCVTITMYLFIRKELSLKSIMKSIFKPLIAGLIMFVAVYPITRIFSPSLLHTLIIVIVAVLIYGISIILLREKFTLKIIENILKKFKKEKN